MHKSAPREQSGGGGPNGEEEEIVQGRGDKELMMETIKDVFSKGWLGIN